MYTIAVCDDSSEQLAAIKTMLNAYQSKRPGTELQVSLFNSPEQMSEELNAGKRFNLYLLDILMPKIDGIELAQKIRALDNVNTVIFLTQSESYALEAYRVSAKQYLLKPLKEDDLFRLLDKIIARSKEEKDRFYTLSAPGRTMNILYSSIIVIEYIGRTMRFHLTTGGYIESKTIRTAFNYAAAEILEDNRFLPVHQSFIINMAHVRELQNRSIFMDNGIEIPIPRPKYVAVKKAYLSYLAELSAKMRICNSHA
jgi:DNA-binding LytR/AlgR family response regulator